MIEKIATGDEIELDVEQVKLTNLRTGESFTCAGLGDVGPILAAGGIFNYAKQEGML